MIAESKLASIHIPSSTPEPSTVRSGGTCKQALKGTSTLGATIPHRPRPTITVISQASSTVATRAVSATPRRQTKVNTTISPELMNLAASRPRAPGINACTYCVPIIAVIGVITAQAIV